MSDRFQNSSYSSSPIRHLSYWEQAHNEHSSIVAIATNFLNFLSSIGNFLSSIGNFLSSIGAYCQEKVVDVSFIGANCPKKVAFLQFIGAYCPQKVADSLFIGADGSWGGNVFTRHFAFHSIESQLVTRFFKYFMPMMVQHQPLVALHRLKPMRSCFFFKKTVYAPNAD